MGSGKYGALSGAIARMQMLDNINNRLANSSSSGYKKGVEVFADQLDNARATREKLATDFVHVTKEIIDFTQGQLKKTGDPLNLAINGKGFFRVQRPDGQIVYARRGGFRRNADGEMLTTAGAKLLARGDSPVVLPKGDFNIARDGSILSDNQRVGTIPLYDFADTRGLKRGVDGVFIAPPDAEVTQDPQPEMLQGYLEGSNVNVMQEMGRLVYTQRVFEATQKALTSYDKMDSSIADLGNVQ